MTGSEETGGAACFCRVWWPYACLFSAHLWYSPRTPISVTPLQRGHGGRQVGRGPVSISSLTPREVKGLFPGKKTMKVQPGMDIHCKFSYSLWKATASASLSPSAVRLTDKGFFLRCLTGNSLISL